MDRADCRSPVCELNYSSSAAALGLSDGYIFRLQGGAKLGLDSTLADTRLTTVLTGLIFDDVAVHGNNIQAGSFGPSGNILSDQGKVQGEAIASINFDLGVGYPRLFRAMSTAVRASSAPAAKPPFACNGKIALFGLR